MKKNNTEILTIIIPTFNEVKNVDEIIKRLNKVLNQIKFRIIFVDDNSSDGTIDKVKENQLIHNNIDLIIRVGRRALAGACIEGLLNSSSQLVAIIDCDLQHDENILPKMYALFKKQPTLDLVVGSRHIDEGTSSSGFSLLREYGSKIAIKVTQILLRIKISDPMSGFFMVKNSSLLPIIKKLQPDGFKILADILASVKGRWNIKEVGYIFRKRKSGDSKMNVTVILELIALILSHLSFRFFSIRFIMFGMVGASGILVQLISTFLLMNYISLDFIIAHILSVIIAMTSNFSLNNILTFKDKALTGTKYIKGLLTFYLVCSIGAFLNIAIADYLFKNFGLWIFSSVSGAFIAALWNFLFNSIITWKTK